MRTILILHFTVIISIRQSAAISLGYITQRLFIYIPIHSNAKTVKGPKNLSVYLRKNLNQIFIH